VNHTLNMR